MRYFKSVLMSLAHSLDMQIDALVEVHTYLAIARQERDLARAACADAVNTLRKMKEEVYRLRRLVTLTGARLIESAKITRASSPC